MPAPSRKIKLSGALSAPAKAPHSTGSRRATVSSTSASSSKSWRSKLVSLLTGSPPKANADELLAAQATSTRPASSHKPLPTQENTSGGRGRARATGRASLLPGGVWLWCLLGLATGLGVWLGGRSYLRNQLVEQLSSTQSEAVALQSIDALLRLDADATIDVSRGLGHPEFIVANAAYRALTGQLDAWRSLPAAEQLRRMQQVVQALQQLPADIDQDHRILLAGLASRIYADALSHREAGTGDLLAGCKRIMAMSEPSTTQEPTVASVSNLPSARLANVTSFRTSTATASLSDGETTDEGLSTPVPPPLPPVNAQPVTTHPVNSPAEREIIQKNLTDIEQTDVEQVGQPEPTDASRYSLPSLESSSASRAVGMPRLTALGSDLSANSSRASMQLTSASSTTAASMSRKAQAAMAQAARDEQLAEATITGMEELPIEQLVRLLASIQPRVSQAAALMLRQRGMSDAHLELAIELATGSMKQRQDLLQSIAARDDLDPRPWLLWMAADGEVAIRQQAVGLLGPLLDNDVRRRLRLLLNKESDEQVASTLRRVLSQ